MAGGNNLEVTSILDPDINEEDVSITENDIDLELNEALGATDDDLDFNLSDDIPGLEDLFSDDPDFSGTDRNDEQFLLDEHELGIESKPAEVPEDDLEINFDDTLRLEESLPLDTSGNSPIPAQDFSGGNTPQQNDDDDVDFELDSVVETNEVSTPGASGDLDFNLDEFSLEPASEPDPASEDEDIDFELMDIVHAGSNSAGESKVDLEAESGAIQEDESAIEDDFGMDFGDTEEEPASISDFDGAEEATAGSMNEADNLEFDLDNILAQSEDEGPAIEEETATDDFEEPEDFELEEVIAETPHAQPEDMVYASDLNDAPPVDMDFMSEAAASEALAEGVAASEVAATSYNGLHTEPSESEMQSMDTTDQAVAMDIRSVLDPARIEQIIEQTVRDTVGRVLEKVLPGVIEEAVTRELAKITQELNE